MLAPLATNIAFDLTDSTVTSSQRLLIRVLREAWVFTVWSSLPVKRTDRVSSEMEIHSRNTHEADLLA
jgi:hypothetical protein